MGIAVLNNDGNRFTRVLEYKILLDRSLVWQSALLERRRVFLLKSVYVKSTVEAISIAVISAVVTDIVIVVVIFKMLFSQSTKD